MIVRELPCATGRFFEVDSWNAVLQTEVNYTYFILTCQCSSHRTPITHLEDAADLFIPNHNYVVTSPYNAKWIHVIENNEKGYAFYRSIK